jgi:hypothetical protein
MGLAELSNDPIRALRQSRDLAATYEKQLQQRTEQFPAVPHR